MSGIINKVKEVLHHDKTHETTGVHTTGAHSTHSGTAEGVAGPHNSRAANAADPRVDSDLDGSRNAGAASGTTGYGTSTGAGYGSTGTHATTGAGYGSTGTHAATGAGYSSTGTHATTGAGYGNTGPVHNSEVLNKLDPRVNTANTTTGNTHTTGAHTTGGLTHSTGTTGGLSNSTNAGPHDSNLANKVDPRVDSDLDGRGNRVGASHGGILGASGSHATPGSGTAQNTAGPHNSDLANKIDPRVDSNLDGSGGSRTHA